MLEITTGGSLTGMRSGGCWPAHCWWRLTGDSHPCCKVGSNASQRVGRMGWGCMHLGGTHTLAMSVSPTYMANAAPHVHGQRGASRGRVAQQGELSCVLCTACCACSRWWALCCC